MRPLISMYSWRYPLALVYMLQASEYQMGVYLKWLLRTRDFSLVQHRRKLDLTARAKLLLFGLIGGMMLEIGAGIALVIYGLVNHMGAMWAFGAALIIAYPLIWPFLIILPLEFARVAAVEPKQRRKISASSAKFANHRGVKIAVAGSYGKTTMKEVLKTVLTEGMTVAATEANHNVPIEHAKFADRLNGNEDILIIEYGEGRPGDITQFAKNTHPTHAVITGLAPAHLNKYPTLAAAGADIFSLAEFVSASNIFVNSDSEPTKPFLKPGFVSYGSSGVEDWKVSKIKVTLSGLSFSLSSSKKQLNLASQMLGRHQIGTLSLAAVLGLKLGLSKAQVEAGVSKTRPYEHRMQPYNLAGAWVIDDTYNGNIDGIKAGTAILKELTANRKIYVTPGLVDQGVETERVHQQMGELIAASNADLVVLMQNSVTKYIESGLKAGGFKGELRVENDPLGFYQNLEQFVASGDLVLMQNDWPDNYA